MSRKGHVPLRRCLGCRRVRPQAELLRLAQPAGMWQLDLAKRAGGRGFWVCDDSPACWTPKRLGRSFRAQTEAVCALLRARGDAPARANPTHYEPSHHEPNHHELTLAEPNPDRRHNV